MLRNVICRKNVVCIIDNVTLLEEEIVAVIHNLESNKAGT